MKIFQHHSHGIFNLNPLRIGILLSALGVGKTSLRQSYHKIAHTNGNIAIRSISPEKSGTLLGLI